MPSKAKRFRDLIESPNLSFLMEAHNGLSARIVEETGFEAVWASGLSISAALGVRDSNEASWTQVLEVLEFMSDATSIPILVDGDTGYGNFNNMRRLVRKLEQRNIGGVCIEDKVFPKTNSFLNGKTQPLADMDEFCGKIKAGKDAQAGDEFVIIARVEAFIAGWGLTEALRRAEAYYEAGADAILMHSSKSTAEEVVSFTREWAQRSPVVLVPTKYYSTPTDVFREEKIAAVIWANHLMRSCVRAMQTTASRIFEEQSLVNVEEQVASLAEVFRLQGAEELAVAEQRYLPQQAGETRVLLLAAKRGEEMRELTANRPKAMVPVGGRPVLSHIVDTYRRSGIKDINIIRGYCKDAINLSGVGFIDNNDADHTDEAWSLFCASSALEGDCIISYGDVLFKKFIALQLMESDADFTVMVDTNWRESRNRDRYADYVQCSADHSRQSFYNRTRLLEVSDQLDANSIHGEWMGFLKLSRRGSQILQQIIRKLRDDDADVLKTMDMGDLLNALVAAGHEVRVIYTTGNWLDCDSVEDALDGSRFQ